LIGVQSCSETAWAEQRFRNGAKAAIPPSACRRETGGKGGSEWEENAMEPAYLSPGKGGRQVDYFGLKFLLLIIEKQKFNKLCY
jgi:hypothetical protein